MKTCSVCGEVKSTDLFPKDRSQCKICYSLKKKEYAIKNKDKIKVKNSTYYINNKEKVEAQKKEYKKNNRDKVNAAGRAWYAKNKEKSNAWKKRYYENNKEKVIKRHVKNRKIKYHSCPKFNLITRLRSITRAALKSKGIYKTKSTFEYLGCTREQLREHMQSLFRGGMSWENKGKGHVDHIIPISSGNTEEEILRLNHYTNLQPLWAADNIRKSDKIIEPHKEDLNEQSK